MLSREPWNGSGEGGFLETASNYGMRVCLDIPYEDAIDRVTGALQAEGFGVLTEIDVQATLEKKIGATFRRYVILGACNPVLAQQALETELEIGLLLPCNVIVYEDAGGSVVSIADPDVMMQAAATEGLRPLAAEARARLERVLEALNSD